jgi:hypothetical protein
VGGHGNLLADDDARKDAFGKLVDAVDGVRAGREVSYRDLLDAYAQVTAFTYGEYGVNGRTVLDTVRSKDVIGTNGAESLLYRLKRPRARPLLLGGTLLFLVGVFEGILLITGSTPAYVEIHKTLIDAKILMLPLVWGALGSCAFLTKKLSDTLSDFAFEEARARGIGSRVFLGAILGLIVVELTRGQVGNFPIYLIAFLSGLGIKPVYAAIECLVEGLAARVKLPTKPAGKA